MSSESPEVSSSEEIREEMRLSSSPAVRYFYIAAGTVSFVIGMFGLLLPVMPTSPFLLLAAFCYARGSERFYYWLITNRYFGEYVRALRKGEGIPLRIKLYAILVLGLTLGSTVIFIVPYWPLKILLALVGAAVAGYIAQLPTKPE